ncbi:hypothetical protein Angca_002007 [Angiostrongylus cantonensis]|nr:hypothetical protein Angca_002007 [Angiostrongylus cantonensis]
MLEAGPQVCPLVDDTHGNHGYYLPQASETGSKLERMLRRNQYFGHICLLTTTLCIPISAFTLDKIENVAPRPPAIPDYRFRMLTDKSRLDFTIRCRDGNILVAKEGIFLASEYFRNYLESADHTDANFGDVNREPVLIAITFALTGTMAPPEFLSPSIVNDVIDTARRIHALNYAKLRNALEEEAIQWAIKQNEDLSAMLAWFICSHQCGMANLHMVCLAYIARNHATQYLQQYTDESMVVASSSADPEMAENLNRRQGILRPTAHQRIVTIIRTNSKVRSVARIETNS